MKTRRSPVLFLALLFLSFSLLIPDTEAGYRSAVRKVVRIPVEGREQVNILAGIAEPLEVRREHVVIDVTEREIDLIRSMGFSVEVLFQSVDDVLRSPGMSPSRAGPDGLYHSYSEVKNELLQLATSYPHIAKVYDIGDSWEKTQGIADRDILAIKISDNVSVEENEPRALFVGGHHAREWISVEVPFLLAKYLVENYHVDPAIRSYIDNGEIWIVPMLNPDGHQYSIDVDRWWRKNRRNNGDGTFGVDLNRNYGFMWGGEGSSGDPHSSLYRGASAFSEPETQAIRSLSLSLGFRVMLSYHSYGQLILYPWGHTLTPAPDDAALHTMSSDMADMIKQVHGTTYTPVRSSGLYVSSGVSEDWFYGELSTFAFTVEVRPEGYPYFELPESEIIPTFNENKPAALYLIKWSQLTGPVPDISVNSCDGPITIKTNDPLSITIKLDAGNETGNNADWWVLADTPLGWYYYDLHVDAWLSGQLVTYQGQLAHLDPLSVYDKPGLPAGPYTIYFGVDTNVNGSIDVDRLYYDSANVTVTP